MRLSCHISPFLRQVCWKQPCGRSPTGAWWSRPTCRASAGCCPHAPASSTIRPAANRCPAPCSTPASAHTTCSNATKRRWTPQPVGRNTLDDWSRCIERCCNRRDRFCLMKLLAEDVTFWADGGGKVKGVATRLLSGRDTFHSGQLTHLQKHATGRCT